MRLAVIGDPVAHSRSPALHRSLLARAGIDGEYVAVRVKAGETAGAIARLRSDGFCGCNVTYPLKEEAFGFCDAFAEAARQAQAVNTIFFGAENVGTTTDGIGARVAIEALLDARVAGKRIGILGYGATGRAIAAELHASGALTSLWGRNALRVAEFCRRFDAGPWPYREPPAIVISTLPPAVELPADLAASLHGADIVIDANYGERATLRDRLSREVVPGDTMLQAQARASFDFWLSQIDP